jgi:hypothetical protein
MSYEMVWALLTNARMARYARWLGVLALAACVIPVPADLNVPDAAVVVRDADPVILDSNPAMPGPTAISSLGQTFTVTLRDADVSDTLYVRVFHDYDQGFTSPLNDIPVPNDPVTGKEVRGPIELDTKAWCSPASQFGNGNPVIIDVMVADRPYSNDVNATPQFRTLVDKDGKANLRSWVVTCPPAT